MKGVKAWGIVSIPLILFVSIALSMSFISADDEWVIDGNKVYVDDSNAYLSAEPHTIASSEWVYFNLTSKVYEGEIDVVWGFDTDSVMPKKAELYKPRDVDEQRFYTCSGEGYWYNYTLSPNHFWCWLNYTEDNETYQDILIFEHDFDTYNTTTSTAYWTESIHYDWLDITNKFESLSYEHGGMDKWYYLKNVSINADQNYQVRAYVKVPVSLESINGKYWFAVKPSSESISEAVASGHFYYLDPWWNSSWIYKVEIPVNVGDGSTLTNYEMNISINTTEFYNLGKIRSDCGDIRFLNETEDKELPYWNETPCNITGGNTTFWVNVDTINSTIYMYAGNPDATTTANLTATFLFEEYADYINLGDLNGQNSWTGSASFDVVNELYNSSPNSIKINLSGSEIDGTITGNETRVRLWFKTRSVDVVNPSIYVCLTDDSHTSADGYCIRVGYSPIQKGWSGAWVNLETSTTMNINVWYSIYAEYDSVSNKFVRIFVDDVLKDDDTSGYTVNDAFNRIVILTGGGTNGLSKYIDSIRVAKFNSVQPTYYFGAETQSGIFSLSWINPTSNNSVNPVNQTYIFWNISSTNNLTNCSIQINGTNQTGDIASDNMSCSYNETGLLGNQTRCAIGWGYNGTEWSESVLRCANTNEHQFVQDTIPPVITIFSPANTTYGYSAIDVNWSYNEHLIWSAYSINGGANISFADEWQYSGFGFNLAPIIAIWGIDVSWNGELVYVSDEDSNIIRVYYANGTAYYNFSTIADINQYTRGITQNGTYFWAINRQQKKVYQYLINGTPTGFNFSISATSDAWGMDTDNNFIYISDVYPRKVWIYNMGGTLNTSFTPTEMNTYVAGITVWDGFIWLSASHQSPEKWIYKYYTNGTFTGELYEFNTTGVSMRAEAIDTNGEYFWLGENTNDKAWRYYYGNFANHINKTVSFPEGTNLTICANDSAGNIGCAIQFFTVDATLPQIAINSPLNQNYNTNQIFINITQVEDNPEVMWYAFPDEDWDYYGENLNSTLHTNNFEPENLVLLWNTSVESPAYIGSYGRAIHDGVIYSYAGNNLFAIYLNGSIKWNVSGIGGDGGGYDVIYYDGMLYLSGASTEENNKGLYAVYPENGSVYWNWTPNGYVSAGIQGYDGVIYFITQFMAYALYENGTLKWNTTISSNANIDTPIIYDGRIFIGGYYLYSLYLDNGTQDWATSWPMIFGNWYLNGNFLLHNDIIYGIDASNKKIRALYLNGTEEWEYQLAVEPERMTVVGDTIYYAGQNGLVGAIYENGTFSWNATIGSDDFYSIISTDNFIYLKSISGLYRLYLNGTVEMNISILFSDGSQYQAIELSNGMVFVGDWYFLYAFGDGSATNSLDKNITLANGTYELEIYSRDSAGNLNSSTVFFSVNVPFKFSAINITPDDSVNAGFQVSPIESSSVVVTANVTIENENYNTTFCELWNGSGILSDTNSSVLETNINATANQVECSFTLQYYDLPQNYTISINSTDDYDNSAIANGTFEYLMLNAFALNTTSLNFGTLGVGQSSTQQFYLNNTGNTELQSQMKADNLTNGSNVIDVLNMKWDLDSDPSDGTVMTHDFAVIGNITVNNIQDIWIMLTIPSGTSAVVHSGIIYLQT